MTIRGSCSSSGFHGYQTVFSDLNSAHTDGTEDIPESPLRFVAVINTPTERQFRQKEFTYCLSSQL